MFLGSLYGIGYGRGGVDAPARVKELRGMYHTTIRIAWRVSKDTLSTEELLLRTAMPTWERIYKRALNMNIYELRDQKRMYGSLIVRTKDTFSSSITSVREWCVEKLGKLRTLNRKDKNYMSYRKTKHPYT